MSAAISGVLTRFPHVAALMRATCYEFALSAGGEKLRPVEKAVRAVEYREKHRALGRMGDVDVAARPPHEVAGTAHPFGVFQRSLQHVGLFQRRVLVQR